MAMSQTSSFLKEIIADEVIPEGKLAYFRERQKGRLYDFILKQFLEKEREAHFTKADLARRINKSPAQITRWFSSPSNWTLDTISDLMLGVCGGELGFSDSAFTNAVPRNFSQLDNLGRIANTSTSLPAHHMTVDMPISGAQYVH